MIFCKSVGPLKLKHACWLMLMRTPTFSYQVLFVLLLNVVTMATIMKHQCSFDEQFLMIY